MKLLLICILFIIVNFLSITSLLSTHHLKLKNSCTIINCIPSNQPKSILEYTTSKSTSIATKVASTLAILQSLSPLKANTASAVSTVRGYEAAQSAFSPGKPLYAIPTLPQSALLNSLNEVDNELVSEMQAYLESFVQLINPTTQQEEQIEKEKSLLWLNLQINAQRATGMYIYNNDDLIPRNTDNPSSTANYTNEDEKRRNYSNEQLMDDFQKSQYRKRYLSNLKYDVLNLVISSKKAKVRDSLRYMRNSLNSLAEVAYLLTPVESDPLPDRLSYIETSNNISDEFTLSETDESVLTSPYLTLPRLIGRARVTLYFQRPGPEKIVDKITNKNDISTVKLIVDGINHPYTAGNFIDLCQRGYYENIVINTPEILTYRDKYNMPTNTYKYYKNLANSNNTMGILFGSDSKRQQSQSQSQSQSQQPQLNSVPLTLFGSKHDNYTDPFSERIRRIPLEILREWENRSRFICTGASHNTAIYTDTQPVLSFATYGAIGMYHDPQDGNGASSTFFWVRPDPTLTVTERHQLPVIKRLNDRYSLFAYAIEGLDILEKLKQGDILVRTRIEEGAWKLEYPNEENDVTLTS